MMKLTQKKQFMRHGEKHEIQAKYGIDYGFARRNNQAPYFSATADIWVYDRGRWRDDSSGMQHDEIARHFPELSGFLKWHLVSTQEPMHYLANAKYWWEMATGTSPFEKRPYDPDPVQAFQHTIVLGAVPGDKMPDLKTPWPLVSSWLRDRLPKLMGYFMADMGVLGVLE